MTTPKPALPEPVALIDPRALARGDASLHCITRPEYRSIADADAGVEYVPVYTRAAIDAAVAEARAGLERECDDTDKLLRGLGLDPERCRTEGGALNVGKTLTLLADARAVPVAHVEETPAGPKLYVNGVCVRWELGCVHDAAFHELARRINSTNPSPTEARAVPVVAWIRVHPDGTYSDEILPNWQIESVRKESGAWVPLAATPSPTVHAEQPKPAAREAVEELEQHINAAGIDQGRLLGIALVLKKLRAALSEQPAPTQPARVALSDEQIAAAARKGFKDYWTEDCRGSESEAWAASAKAVIAEYERVNGIAPAQGEQT